MEQIKSTAMAETELSQVSNVICEKEPLKADVEVIIKNEGFITFDSEIKKATVDSGNYLADLSEIKIRGETKDGPKELNLFAKNKIQHTFVTFSTDEAYTAETFAYKELHPVFKELENEFDVPASERYRSVKYYDTGNEDVIIMENIAKQGYKVLDRLKVVPLQGGHSSTSVKISAYGILTVIAIWHHFPRCDWSNGRNIAEISTAVKYRFARMTPQYAELGVLELAKFHAFSFAIEKHRPEFFKKVSTLKLPMKFNEDFDNFTRNSVYQSLELIDADKKEKLLNNGFLEFVRNLNLQCGLLENRVNCLCHNDYRVGNIMYKEQNGAIIEMITLDFQLIAVGSPLNDFFYFLLPPTDKKFRSQHLDYLKEYYYKNLAKHLDYFNMDVNEVYNREEFDKDYFRCRLYYGMPISITVLPLHLTLVDDSGDLSEHDTDALTIVKHDVFVNRLNDLVDDFIQWGIPNTYIKQ